MKKILYISTLILALGMVSCNKQDVCPNSADNQVVPSWGDTDKSLTPSTDDSTNGDIGDNGGIVDPNNDPDGKTRRN